jgi:alkaline phosphatase D
MDEGVVIGGAGRQRPSVWTPGRVQLDRRRLLLAGAGAAGAVVVASCTTMPGLDPVDPLWDCGVASGLHAPDAAVLWTRFAPGAIDAVEVGWQLATDAAFTQVVASGTATAGPDADGCVKVLAEGLAPGTYHWYRFVADGSTSPVGRTRTLPPADALPATVRLAVASCQNFASGYYPAWRDVAGLDLDGVVFLGDYIYESAGDPNPLWDVRDDPSEEAVDLGTYRAKYRLYRSDPDLRAAHAAHPFAPVWDDHEFVDNYDAARVASQRSRSTAAYRAWFEYQPVWPIDGTRIHRRLRFGRLAELTLLDTRQHRDPNPARDILVNTLDANGSIVHTPGRSFLGAAQRDWFLEGLGVATTDGVVWNLLGQQVMMAPLRWIDLDDPLLGDNPRHAGIYFNVDQWDGYPEERDRVTAFLHDEGIRNTAVFTGDIHSFWQAAVHTDMERWSSPTVAQEFVCGSISSTALGFSPELAAGFAQLTKSFSPAFRWVDWQRRGYGHVEITPDAMGVEYRTFDVRRRDAPRRVPVRFDWAAGTDSVTVTR